MDAHAAGTGKCWTVGCSCQKFVPGSDKPIEKYDGPIEVGVKEIMNNSWWLIEMMGPCYLAVRHLGGYEFYWDRDHSDALRFYSRGQADMVMMTVRQLRGDLFPACLPDSPRAVEHVWIPGEGVRRIAPEPRMTN
jgi:hypothetical protein